MKTYYVFIFVLAWSSFAYAQKLIKIRDYSQITQSILKVLKQN